jgi:hypothetical protein
MSDNSSSPLGSLNYYCNLHDYCNLQVELHLVVVDQELTDRLPIMLRTLQFALHGWLATPNITAVHAGMYPTIF